MLLLPSDPTLVQQTKNKKRRERGRGEVRGDGERGDVD